MVQRWRWNIILVSTPTRSLYMERRKWSLPILEVRCFRLARHLDRRLLALWEVSTLSRLRSWWSRCMKYICGASPLLNWYPQKHLWGSKISNSMPASPSICCLRYPVQTEWELLCSSVNMFSILRTSLQFASCCFQSRRHNLCNISSYCAHDANSFSARKFCSFWTHQDWYLDSVFVCEDLRSVSLSSSSASRISIIPPWKGNPCSGYINPH